MQQERWLEEGLAVLGELGIDGVRIDRLAERLGLSKGSFYHHFAGMAGYRLALLDHFETRFTTHYIEAVEAGVWPSPRAKLDQLIRLVSADAGAPGDVGLETGMRAWAAVDDDARATLERVDGRRIDYLAGLLAELDPGSGDSRLLGRALYLTLVGARHVVPPVPFAEVADIFERLIGALETGSAVGPGSGRRQ